MTKELIKENFYEFINMEWLKNTIIPSDESRWSTFNILSDQNYDKLKDLLESHNSHPEAPKAKILYQQYINNNSIKDLENILNTINNATTKDELLKLVYHLNEFSLDIPISTEVYNSLNDSSKNILHVSTGGLGLPDKEYYFSNAEDKVKARSGYKNFLVRYINTVNSLLTNNVGINMNYIYKIEENLAEFEYSNVEKRDPNLMNNEMNFEAVQKLYPQLGLNLFFGNKIEPQVVNISNPKFLKNYLKFYNESNLELLKQYYKWIVVVNLGKYSHPDLEKEIFDFYGTTLQGVKQMKPLWKRAIMKVENNVGMVLSKMFVNKYFTQESYDTCNLMVQSLKSHFRTMIQTNNWMEDSTKLKAINKLDSMELKIGYPKVWREYGDLEILETNSYLRNILNCKKFEYDYSLTQLYKPIDPNIWFMNPHDVNAYYSPSNNEIVFPAGILQPPFFDKDNMTMSYGGIGCVIGHEMTHGFDDEGRKFDSKGNLVNWWTKSDEQRFNDRTINLIEQFNNSKILGRNVNGKLTLGENLADLGGVTISLSAFKEYLDQRNLTEDERNKELFNFFKYYCNIWKCKYTNESMLVRLSTDPHSPPEFRVNNILLNVPEFYEIIQITSTDKKYLREEDRTKVW